ncbi:SAM-dependent methyltransferase [Streptomyces sp. DSM 42041]|uniref:SAM-dependent methyltransferase n=1 Tax=Streptomyces hazeniae TaxID=3075538 RepID=A0ABU2NV90_9ACTN|nr:SAM-dependent methyltransferase [Streptomyces sp. DSM 42041]MDT0379922.1 SAM-dependent methyltransferase [Streptomyces sp. DSM 42041]
MADDGRDGTRGDTIADKIDNTVPHSARVWNYLLGGKDNYEPDRQIGDHISRTWPGLALVARTSRHMLARAVRHLAADAGVRQFLDVGTGLPTVDNTHEVAQSVAPDARVVYVDNDPLVLVHAQALLTSTPEGATAYVDADLGDADTILAEAAEVLDMEQPVALILMGIIGHVADYDEARAMVRRLLDGLPSGSYLLYYDGTATSEAMLTAQEEYNRSGAVPYYVRTPEQIAGFFEGLDLVEPGVVPVTAWRPDPEPEPPATVDAYGGLARKP